MNLEAQQKMMEEFRLRNPDGMLKKNRSGTADPTNHLYTQKYDQEKNIILKKNPFILTEKTVGNRRELDK